MKPKSRILSLLLAICLAIGLMPTTAFAAGTGAITEGTDILKTNANTSTAATVYYGGQSWRVIGYDGTGVASSNSNAVTLITAGNPLLSAFDSTWTSNAYASSTLKTSVEEIANRFSDAEKLAVVKRTLESGSYNDSSTDCVAGAAISNALLWPLSTAEADSMDKNLRIVDPDNPGWATSFWWLRSPGNSNFCAAAVAGNGDVIGIGHIIHSEFGVRPAFNLDLNAVLFTSAAANGKQEGLNKIGDYNVNEWKLTLKDSSRSFNVTEQSANGEPGDTIKLNYTGATTGENEYISVIIEKSGEMMYYGRVVKPDAESGTATLTIPADLAPGSYTLNVFSEQYNGGEKDDTKLTDYASAFDPVALTVSSDTTAPTLTPGNTTRDSDTAATVKFTSNEAGSYYYAVVDSGASEPAIDTTGTGTSCDTTEQTISLTNFSGTGAKDIYIVVKDAAGNESEKLKITIPAYVAPSYDIVAYRLTFDTNGGSEIASIRRAEYSTIDLSNYKPTREGYEFTGWYADKDLTEKITSIRLTRNTTVYAGWEENPSTGFENPFTDVSENDWFFGDVKFVYQNGLMNGTSETTFSPDGTTSRGMIVTILWRMAGSPDMKDEILGYPFQDVDANAYYATAVYWARLNGIADGYGDNKFGPDKPITREQLAAILYRYAQHKGYDTTQGGMAIREYADYGQISSYALEAMDWANATGIVTGTSEKILSPQGQATRAQAAAMFTRFCKQYAEK